MIKSYSFSTTAIATIIANEPPQSIWKAIWYTLFVFPYSTFTVEDKFLDER